MKIEIQINDTKPSVLVINAKVAKKELKKYI